MQCEYLLLYLELKKGDFYQSLMFVVVCILMGLIFQHELAREDSLSFGINLDKLSNNLRVKLPSLLTNFAMNLEWFNQ